MIDNNAKDGILGEWVYITNDKMERYQGLIDRLRRCLEDLREKKEVEIKKKEDKMQEDRFKRRME